MADPRMAHPRAIVPYRDPHDDDLEYVNNILSFHQNPNPTLEDLNPVSASSASPNLVPNPSGGPGFVDANATLNNPGLSNTTTARNDQPRSSSCRGGTSARREDLAPEDSNFVPRPPSIVPEHSIPYTCSCCYVLREINHTNGNHGVRLELHGSIGGFCHAILENTYRGSVGTVDRQHHVIELKHKSMEEVKTFLLQYLEEKRKVGYTLIQDPLTIFYDTLCVGLQFHGTTNNATQQSNNHGSDPFGSQPSRARNLDPGPSSQRPSTASGGLHSRQFGLGPSRHFGAGQTHAGPTVSGSSGQRRLGAGLHVLGNLVSGPSGAGPQVSNNVISGSSGSGNSGAEIPILRQSCRITLNSRPFGSSLSIPWASGSGPSAAQPSSRGPSRAEPLVSRPSKSRRTRGTSLVIRDNVNQQEEHAEPQAAQNANQVNMPRRQGRRPRNDGANVNQQDLLVEPQAEQGANEANMPHPQERPRNDAANVNQQEAHVVPQGENQANMPRPRGRPRNDAANVNQHGAHMEPQAAQDANQANIPRPRGRPRNDAARSDYSLQRERVQNMTVRDIEPYFDLPIKVASERLQLCVTVIKRICRKGNVERWPYRKIKALQDKIDKLRSEMSMRSSTERAIARMEIARHERNLIAARAGRRIN